MLWFGVTIFVTHILVVVLKHQSLGGIVVGRDVSCFTVTSVQDKGHASSKPGGLCSSSEVAAFART